MSLHLLTRYGLSPAGGVEGGQENLIAATGSASSTSSGNQFGWEFTANQNLTLVGLRYRAAFSVQNPSTLRVWRAADQQLLGSVNVAGVQDEWIDGMLDSPVALASGSNYVLTHRAASGAARGFYYTPSAQATFSGRVTFVRGRTIASDAFPASTNTNLYLVDGIVEV